MKTSNLIGLGLHLSPATKFYVEAPDIFRIIIAVFLTFKNVY